jgi:hypothetical protein
MTLHERNRFITVFLFFSLAIILSFLVLFIRAIVQERLGFPVISGESVLTASKPSRVWFAAPYSFYSVLASIVFLTITVPLVTLLMILHFEKTQAQECLYFAIFLFSCLAEATRLCIPIFDLWQGNSALLLNITRVLVFGRLLAPMAFLFSAVFAITRQNRDVERNVMVLVAVAGIIATLIPINTTRVLPTCIVETGFASFFTTFNLCLYGLTILCLLVQTKNAGVEHKFLLLGFILLYAGYLLLIQSASFLEFGLGFVAFAVGNFLYLVNLHKSYV